MSGRSRQAVGRRLKRLWRSYWRHPQRVQRSLERLSEEADHVRNLLSDISWQLEVKPHSCEEGPLWTHGFKAYSQQDEDGIIEEIFRRIGTSSSYFVEFGAQNGICNNTLYLLARGWDGLWLERWPPFVEQINRTFASLIAAGQLKMREEFVTAENIVRIFEENGVPRELDLLSIDIDGNDYWVWKALSAYRPRVIVIEYNSGFGPSLEWIQPYDPEWVWTGGRNQGASLKALENLGRECNYRLVGCNYSGVNAFFVRSDLASGHFPSPGTAEFHYRRPRYYWSIYPGHRPDSKEVLGFVTARRKAAALRNEDD